VDQLVVEGVTEADVDRWVRGACLLCSNGCGIEVAVANTFIISYRKRQREPQPTASSDVRDWQLARTALSPSAGLKAAETEALGRLPDARIEGALQTLPAAYRTVVYLADIEGYAYREIAEIMGTPTGTVMSRLHRARSQLRRLLQDDTSGSAGNGGRAGAAHLRPGPP
jgi:RNA polymerase sigma-70 factor (ECF subfamily)